MIASRIIVAAVTATALSTCVAGCGMATVSESVEESTALHMQADSDLLAPPASQTFTVNSGPQVTALTHEGVELISGQTTTDGVLVISDGIMTEAEISATFNNQYEFTFTLIEPVLFERQGRVSESIVAIGSVSSESITFPRVKMVLEPTVTDQVATVDATLEIPESVTGHWPAAMNKVELQMTLNLVEQ